MAREPDVRDVAGSLQVAVGLIRRQLQRRPAAGGLTLPETAALSHLDRSGPMTGAELARLDQVSPQSMGVTLAGLEGRGLVSRRPDPVDGRRVVLSLSPGGRRLLARRRSARTDQLAQALSQGFDEGELETLAAAAPLLERLAANL